ncbi:hypothetical protein [Castellaniella sp.]|uniref:hypothetical protein n=1 Tax=Castellaniella sp. TaxID=1955812 RepID=UPI002AFE67EB|nr:hypothetical protein [Castellaniella sp.]
MSITAAASIATIKTAIDALSSIQSAAVLRERIALIQDQMALLEKAAGQAEAKIADQAKEIEELRAEVASYRETEQYAEYMGALFKRKPGGRNGYQEVPYCPRCHTAAGRADDDTPYFCAACQWFSSFNAGEVGRIVRELE